MSTNTIVLIAVIAAIVLLLGAFTWLGRNRRDKRRRAEAASRGRHARVEKRRVTLGEARDELARADRLDQNGPSAAHGPTPHRHGA